MGSPLELFLANSSLSYHEENWLNNCPQGFKSAFYRRCINDFSSTSNRSIIYSIFKIFEILIILICHFLWIGKWRTNYPFLTFKSKVIKITLEPQFIENLLLVAYIVTLKVFYLWHDIYFSLSMFLHLLKLGTIQYWINFSERDISKEWLPWKLYWQMF